MWLFLASGVFPLPCQTMHTHFISVYGALALHISLQETKDERGLIYELTKVFNDRAFLGINYRTSYFLVLTNYCATTKLQLSLITHIFLTLAKYTRVLCLTAGCAVIADFCAIVR